MDVTTVNCSRSTRDRLAEFRDARDHANYDVALKDLLEEVGAEA